MPFSVDIELTNRCNAKCHFCPRDQTPHEGLMSPDVFDQSLRRAEEYRTVAADLMNESVGISLCGLGEPLLNRHAAKFVRQVKDAGFDVSLSSNGSVLSEEKGEALLDAGLERILINVGDEGEEYESVYKLPFEKTRANVTRFAEMAEGRCEVYIVLVDHHRDPDHIEHMKEYWKQHGISRFYTYEIMNRGGALFVDHMQFESYPELAEARALVEPRAGTPLCGAPFAYLFIGYDGQYYLCCSDWKKETPMGSVFDESFQSVAAKKLAYIHSRDPVCRTCNLDPLNRLTEELRAAKSGTGGDIDLDAMVESVVANNEFVHMIASKLGVSATEPTSRKSIPVQAI
jgi:MoaA/NifB/PqqE/SkfB family radical SAM enzyme